MEPKPKRSRSVNWDSSDKILLRQLIEDKLSIIENKSVDTNTSRMKKDAWREITYSFNNMSATMRETSQLQAQWRGTKMKAKSVASAYKKNINATGGGPPPKSPDPEHDKLMALIPHEFEEDENEFDCDLEMMKENILSQEDTTFSNQEEIQINQRNPLTTSYNIEEIEFLEDETPNKYISPSRSASPTPRLDASKKNKPKSFKRKTTSKDDELLKQKLFDLAIENRNLEKSFMRKEHEEKIKTILMERTQKQNMYDLERSQKEELHQLKMKRLQDLSLDLI